jgi:hypothetical protein
MLVLRASNTFAASAGPQPAVTGAPAIAGQAAESLCIQCHNQFPANPDGDGSITIDGVPPKYEPGKTYTLTVHLAHKDAKVLRWGFQMTAIAMSDGSGAGEFSSDGATTQVLPAAMGTRSYIEHNYGGTAIGQTGGTSWTFDWKAPAARIGRIGFFAAGNCANADGSNQGDRIYTHSPAPIAETSAGS